MFIDAMMNEFQSPLDFMHPKGIECMIMNTQETVDYIIEDFRKAIEMGLEPNDVKYQIFERRGVSPADLPQYEQERLVKAVDAIYESRAIH